MDKLTKSNNSGQADDEKKPKETGWFNATVAVAIIGALSAVIIAIINAPWLLSFLPPTPTPIVAVTLTGPATEVPNPTPTVFEVFTFPPPSDVPSQPPSTLSLNEVLWVTVDLTASLTSGKAPFKVKFNADNSTFQLGSGEVISCNATRSCIFTWTIHSDGKIDPFQTPDGRMEYPFTVRGNYVVVVTVCRDIRCDSDQVEIEVK